MSSTESTETTQASDASKPAAEKKVPTVVKDPRVDTALHIIKGAIVKVLNTPLTASVQFTSVNKGRIVIEYSAPEKPSAQQIQQIEDLTNEKIRENLQPQHFVLNREEAEERFKDKVNNTFIYDKFKVPASVTEVTIVLWEGWNVNCCRGPHAPAGELGYLKIERVNHRDRKKELEFCFALVDEAEGKKATGKAAEVTSKPPPGKAQAKKAGQDASKDAGKTKGATPDNIPFVSKAIVDRTYDVLTRVFKDDPQVLEKLKSKETEIRTLAEPSIAVLVNNAKNTAYGNGFDAGKSLRN
eukprot:TRINITY_DN2109_c0_g1_i1.p1 TRINITY_DN2109_c0_g1~~TRINITY_DN2109_c0_g1_i1.p1  ORF type:complete len:321 (-),score=91.24 TRINITY_DN2109_c0_g1_i1:84-977(-)